jgi:hypothetical protein
VKLRSVCDEFSRCGCPATGVPPRRWCAARAERTERGLSLATLARLSSALGLTIDDLLHGEDPEIYRIGRRTGDPQGGSEQTLTLLGDATSRLRIDLVRLDAREAGSPIDQQKGIGIVAVAAGLIQVRIAEGTPAARSGEVLVADSDRVEGWRNPSGRQRPCSSGSFCRKAR